MCGITGFVDFKQQLNESILDKMTDSIAHRGPDSAGKQMWQLPSATVGFGHRRLSILDLSPAGNQPQSRNGWHIIFNGEVYNFKEIRTELEGLGEKFYSNSDTEMILAAFEQWGTAAVERFIGMFTFVLYHETSQKVYIFRDRAGVKPLYYYYKDGLLLFSSELKPFHEVPQFTKKINQQGLRLFFQYGWIPAPYTIFEDCHKLRQGHFMTIDLASQQVATTCYWKVTDYYNRPKLAISEQDALTQVEDLLISACNYRMVSDVPVGVFLSGGYDSSAVTAILQKHSGQQIKTFTIGFEEDAFNEAHYARTVADYLGTTHTEQYCTTKEALDIIPRLPFIYDEPFGDSSAIPTTLVSQIARRDVTVALSADGGDEIFIGYSAMAKIHHLQQRLNKIPNTLQPAFGSIIKAVSPEKWVYGNPRFSKFDKIGSILTTKNYWKYYPQAQTDAALDFLLLQKSTTPLDTYFDNKDLNSSDPFDSVLSSYYQTYMADDILTKVDRAGMSVSLEGREPLLDHRLIELVAQLPTEMKYKNGNLKHLLKTITHKYLPREMMERPKKGFGVPITAWMTTHLREMTEYYLNEERIKSQGILNPKAVQIIKNNAFATANQTNSDIFWFLLVFQMWHEHWFEKQITTTASNA